MWLKKYLAGIMGHLMEDHKVDIYLYEKDKKIGSKGSVPYVPPMGSVIEIEDDGRLFMVETVFIGHSFGVVHLYGYIMDGMTKEQLHR
ncbi:hypothetical protein ED312_06590 [Sinomicrobium pectinilyticum]|uniref:Uncharacterized protein n=1 Tax=Sinomicrobium pectinilyticum TaxID=1084421 RepID=A0A3N0EQW7_SINP1|nr:hypothetical protein [Sinomicrobium pectinilyticum]RNL90089.1 hypothetical protein ED312_06590 [Sinomicrobium pectinilyticum]